MLKDVCFLNNEIILIFKLYSTGYLATFLDFITYSYMIDNIILLITGTLHQRPIAELVKIMFI